MNSIFAKYTASVLLVTTLLLGSGISTAFAMTNESVRIASYFKFAFGMKSGDTRNPDVLYLKRMLNNDPRTKLASSPCISDDIDTYYDKRTEDAVYRFQRIYGGERVGLGLVPTGKVGSRTRSNLNQLLKSSAYSNVMATSMAQAMSSYLVQAGSNSSFATSNNPVVNNYFNQVNYTIQNSSTTVPSTSTTPINPNLPQNVQNYLNQANQIVASVSATGTASSVPPTVAPSNNSTVTNYGYTVSNALNTGTAAINIASQSTTTAPNSPNATFVPTPLLTPIPGGNEGIQNYFNNANSAVQTGSANITAASGTYPPAESTVQNYLGVGTQVLTQSGTSTIIASGTVASFDPTILTVNPITLTDCTQSITISGENFSTSTNLVLSSLGSLIVPATITSSNQNGSTGTLTFNLKQFSDYFYYQSIFAGQTRDIRMVVMANGKISNQAVILRFTFPGEKRSNAAMNATYTNYPGNIPDLRGSAQGGLVPNSTSTDNSSIGSLIRTAETFDRSVFAETPHGISLKNIGGSGAIDTVYGLTPSGTITQKLIGKTPGVINLVGLGVTSVNATSSNGGNGGGSNIGTAIGIAAAGIGLAAGVSALSGGAQAATNQIIRGFGGRVIITYPCTCSFNFIVTLLDARGPAYQLMFQPGVSFLKMNFNIFTPGVNVLGTFLLGPSIPCLMYVGVACVPFGLPIGTIIQVGTSLVPGI